MAGTKLRGGFDQGWLTFESTNSNVTVLRRLVPLPEDWESADDRHLELMCRSAEEVVRPGTAKQPERPVEQTDQT